MAITGYFIDTDWRYQEVLLGFKPVYGSHIGANLSGVLLQTLIEHDIEGRVFGITTDNASNNKTLVTSLQQSLQQALADDVILPRIPCLAHVIQLSLQQLLGRIKANPLNESAETKWTEKQSRLAKLNAQHQVRGISYTLNKVRFLAIYVTASPQRREIFYNLQTTDVKLVPIQDVRTRWNSTFLMLRRAKRLRDIFAPFYTEYDCEEMLLNDEEWRQVDYLLCITEPFFDYTTQLSKTRDVTAHYIFKIYNKLFEHLEQSMKQLRRKRVLWNGIQGHLYAISTMLAPVNKFKFFLTNDWDQKWRETYRNSFQQALIPYQEQLLSLSQSLDGTRPVVQLSSKLDKMLDKSIAQPETATNKITQYLDSDTVHLGPLAFWREHQTRFPVIAALARDTLSFPATGAGVERLFNTARDICHYRRGRQKKQTIEELMMFLCTSRFDIEEKEAKYLEKFFSYIEIETAKEEKDEKLEEVEFDLISDTEEADEEISDHVQLDEVDEPQLPAPENSTQVRALGRKRKAQEDEVFEYYSK
ncbi:hypothetical protein N7476_006777 [Penicillium atrosanguineum]|uniref:HAT C-terminal dimerisation domain-containing protein n=1 Tax=Penicillium atrosanguineum TaxID=1132637 RepID=A0A9W9PYC8_9EURO|nr:hypothetical protein N7476_006777 [Penicillium atrosanguineum]